MPDPMSYDAWPRTGSQLTFLLGVLASDTPGCIEWPFFITRDGYGQTNIRGRTVKAHRLVLEMVTSREAGTGKDAAHTPLICHNRACVNPRHLRWATKAEQSADMLIDGTRERQRGEGNPAAKLTEADVRSIRGDSRTAREIAAQYGIASGYVGMIKSRLRWKHLS